MNYFLVVVLVGLSVCSCVTDGSEKKEDVNYKEWLNVAIDNFNREHLENKNKLQAEIDSIRSLVNEVELSSVPLFDSNETKNFEFTFFLSNKSASAPNAIIVTENSYNESAISKLRRKLFELEDYATSMTISRRDTFSIQSRFENRMTAIDKTLNNENPSYARDELLYNQFEHHTLNLLTWQEANFIVVVKNYIYIKPMPLLNNFEPGELRSVIFVFDRRNKELLDSFQFSASNSEALFLEEDSDYEIQTRKNQKRLDENLIHQYNSAINKHLKSRYKIEGEDVYLSKP